MRGLWIPGQRIILLIRLISLNIVKLFPIVLLACLMVSLYRSPI
ncbi:hypothetical protein LINPERHAP1_LOCUS39702 [Linum perenne]